MATGRTFEAVAVSDPQPEDDVEYAFGEWVNGLKDSETPGYVRAFRVPLDEQGKPSYSATGQVRLGSWPIDQYDFDGLCTKILKEYMLPTETMMAVRLMGTIKGKGGASFNKIVMLQRPNSPNLLPVQSNQPGGFADVLTSMQQGQERMMRLFQEMAGNKGGGETSSEMMKFAAMMRVMMEPMTTMMAPILAAVAGRPQSAPGPSTSLKETMETMMLFDRFMGKRGGDGRGSRSDFAEIATAVSGVAKPVLEMAAASMQQNMRNRNRVPQTAPTTQPPTAQIPTQPVQNVPIPAQATPPIATPVPVAPGGVDLSAPSTPHTSPFDPAADTFAPSSTFIGDTRMFGEIKKQIDALVLVASQGSDAKAVADQFFDDVLMELGDKTYGRLCVALESSQYLTTLSAYNPTVQQYAEWFGVLRTRLIEHIVAADRPDSPNS